MQVSTQNHRLVESRDALAALCERLRGQSPLALDTEFIRERSYRPRLELVQVAAPDGTLALIDYGALGRLDGDPFAALLVAPAVLKVFHAADQDLELLRPLTGRVPGPVWDTQLAAGLFPYDGRIGYAAMVEALLGVRLEKGETLTDWSRRPLTAQQQRYAADDVRYLLALYARERETLAALGRVAWAEEECERLRAGIEHDLAELDAARHLHRQVRGWRDLDARGLAVLHELAAWREHAARTEDRPRGTILKDELLCEIARRAPSHPGQLRGLRGLSPGFLERHGAGIVAAVRRGLDTPPGGRPAPAPVEGRPEGPGQALLALLQSVLQTLAAEQGVSAPLLATTAELQRLVHAHLGGTSLAAAECPLLGGWRQALAGEFVQEVLAGRRRVRWDPAARAMRLDA